MVDDLKRKIRAMESRRRLTTAPAREPPKLIFLATSVRELVLKDHPALRPFVALDKTVVDEEIAICIGPGLENAVTPDGILWLRVDDVPYTIASLLQFFKFVQGGMAIRSAFQGLIAALTAKETP